MKLKEIREELATTNSVSYHYGWPCMLSFLSLLAFEVKAGLTNTIVLSKTQFQESTNMENQTLNENQPMAASGERTDQNQKEKEKEN